jgi:hypothetical protein
VAPVRAREAHGHHYRFAARVGEADALRAGQAREHGLGELDLRSASARKYAVPRGNCARSRRSPSGARGPSASDVALNQKSVSARPSRSCIVAPLARSTNVGAARG